MGLLFNILYNFNWYWCIFACFGIRLRLQFANIIKRFEAYVNSSSMIRNPNRQEFLKRTGVDNDYKNVSNKNNNNKDDTKKQNGSDCNNDNRKQTTIIFTYHWCPSQASQDDEYEPNNVRQSH